MTLPEGVRALSRTILPVAGAGVLLWSASSAVAGTAIKKFEKHYAVTGRPVVVIHNIGDGRIEIKSAKNSEVVVSATQSSDKVGVDVEQAGDRVDVNTMALDPAAQPSETEVNFELSVPEETELQLKTQTGLIYVEQVMGDMTLESVAGDVHLKEVSGYIIVRTTGGSLVCTQCAGKLDF